MWGDDGCTMPNRLPGLAGGRRELLVLACRSNAAAAAATRPGRRGAGDEGNWIELDDPRACRAAAKR